MVPRDLKHDLDVLFVRNRDSGILSTKILSAQMAVAGAEQARLAASATEAVVAIPTA